LEISYLDSTTPNFSDQAKCCLDNYPDKLFLLLPDIIAIASNHSTYRWSINAIANYLGVAD